MRVILLLCLICIAHVEADGLQTHLNQAFASYMEGANATAIPEKEEAFNRALRLYRQLEKEPGNGKLYYNIANSFYELGEYGWATYYYRLAQKRQPRNSDIGYQLTQALIAQGLPAPVEQPIRQNVLFWHYKMAQPERIELFLALLTATVLTVSLYIWSRGETLKVISGVLTLLTLLLLGSISYEQYCKPLEAVVIKSYGLYHSPSEKGAIVSSEPLIPGSSLSVHDIIEDGSWLKISSPHGQVGYLPSEAARIIK